MHDLGTAQEIIRIACKEAESRKADKIYSIKLKAGRLSGITKRHLQETFNLISGGTLASGALLEVEDIPGNGFYISGIDVEIKNKKRKK